MVPAYNSIAVYFDPVSADIDNIQGTVNNLFEEEMEKAIDIMKKEIGKVSSYFSHVNVAAIKLTDTLKVGNKIHVKGNTTDFEHKVSSIQIDRKEVPEAKKGDHIGIKVPEKVRPNDKVFLIE